MERTTTTYVFSPKTFCFATPLPSCSLKSEEVPTKDQDPNDCAECEAKFGVFRRVKYCILCGNHLCSDCMSQGENRKEHCFRCERYVRDRRDVISLVGLMRLLASELRQDRVSPFTSMRHAESQCLNILMYVHRLLQSSQGEDSQSSFNIGPCPIQQLNDIEYLGGLSTLGSFLQSGQDPVIHVNIYHAIETFRQMYINGFPIGEAQASASLFASSDVLTVVLEDIRMEDEDQPMVQVAALRFLLLYSRNPMCQQLVHQLDGFDVLAEALRQTKSDYVQHTLIRSLEGLMSGHVLNQQAFGQHLHLKPLVLKRLVDHHELWVSKRGAKVVLQDDEEKQDRQWKKQLLNSLVPDRSDGERSIVQTIEDFDEDTTTIVGRIIETLIMALSGRDSIHGTMVCMENSKILMKHQIAPVLFQLLTLPLSKNYDPYQSNASWFTRLVILLSLLAADVDGFGDYISEQAEASSVMKSLVVAFERAVSVKAKEGLLRIIQKLILPEDGVNEAQPPSPSFKTFQDQFVVCHGINECCDILGQDRSSFDLQTMAATILELFVSQELHLDLIEEVGGVTHMIGILNMDNNAKDLVLFDCKRKCADVLLELMELRPAIRSQFLHLNTLPVFQWFLESSKVENQLKGLRYFAIMAYEETYLHAQVYDSALVQALCACLTPETPRLLRTRAFLTLGNLAGALDKRDMTDSPVQNASEAAQALKHMLLEHQLTLTILPGVEEPKMLEVQYAALRLFDVLAAMAPISSVAQHHLLESGCISSLSRVFMTKTAKEEDVREEDAEPLLRMLLNVISPQVDQVRFMEKTHAIDAVCQYISTSAENNGNHEILLELLSLFLSQPDGYELVLPHAFLLMSHVFTPILEKHGQDQGDAESWFDETRRVVTILAQLLSPPEALLEKAHELLYKWNQHNIVSQSISCELHVHFIQLVRRLQTIHHHHQDDDDDETVKDTRHLTVQTFQVIAAQCTADTSERVFHPGTESIVHSIFQNILDTYNAGKILQSGTEHDHEAQQLFLSSVQIINIVSQSPDIMQRFLDFDQEHAKNDHEQSLIQKVLAILSITSQSRTYAYSTASRECFIRLASVDGISNVEWERIENEQDWTMLTEFLYSDSEGGAVQALECTIRLVKLASASTSQVDPVILTSVIIPGIMHVLIQSSSNHLCLDLGILALQCLWVIIEHHSALAQTLLSLESQETLLPVLLNFYSVFGSKTDQAQALKRPLLYIWKQFCVLESDRFWTSMFESNQRQFFLTQIIQGMTAREEEEQELDEDGDEDLDRSTNLHLAVFILSSFDWKNAAPKVGFTETEVMEFSAVISPIVLHLSQDPEHDEHNSSRREDALLYLTLLLNLLEHIPEFRAPFCQSNGLELMIQLVNPQQFDSVGLMSTAIFALVCRAYDGQSDPTDYVSDASLTQCVHLFHQVSQFNYFPEPSAFQCVMNLLTIFTFWSRHSNIEFRKQLGQCPDFFDHLQTCLGQTQADVELLEERVVETQLSPTPQQNLMMDEQVNTILNSFLHLDDTEPEDQNPDISTLEISSPDHLSTPRGVPPPDSPSTTPTDVFTIECAESCIGIFYECSLMPEFAPVILHNLSLCHVLIRSLEQMKTTCSSSTRQSLSITHKSIMLLERMLCFMPELTLKGETGKIEQRALPTLLRSFWHQIRTCPDIESFGWMCQFLQTLTCTTTFAYHALDLVRDILTACLVQCGNTKDMKKMKLLQASCTLLPAWQTLMTIQSMKDINHLRNQSQMKNHMEDLVRVICPVLLLILSASPSPQFNLAQEQCWSAIVMLCTTQRQVFQAQTCYADICAQMVSHQARASSPVFVQALTGLGQSHILLLTGVSNLVNHSGFDSESLDLNPDPGMVSSGNTNNLNAMIDCPECHQLVLMSASSSSLFTKCPHCAAQISISALWDTPTEVESITTPASTTDNIINMNALEMESVEEKVTQCAHCPQYLIVEDHVPAVRCPSCDHITTFGQKNLASETVQCLACESLSIVSTGTLSFSCVHCQHTTNR